MRNRLGALEDRFFATVFLGSGLLYIGMVFTSDALAGGLSRVLISIPELLTQTGAYALSRAQISQTRNGWSVYVHDFYYFATYRNCCALGYALGTILLLSIRIIAWIPLVFPVWVFLVSAAILIENPSGVAEAIAKGE